MTQNNITILEEPKDIYSLNKGDKVNIAGTNKDYNGEWTCSCPDFKFSPDYSETELIRREDGLIYAISINSRQIGINKGKIKLINLPSRNKLERNFFSYSEFDEILNKGEFEELKAKRRVN